MTQIGIVVIGRNEGDRLRRCIDSASGDGNPVVYVDSGSTDGSVQWARSRGVEAVELDMSRPFTAARARNAGAERLLSNHPSVHFIQFIDGDCELFGGWLERAASALSADPSIAIVTGRLCERNGQKSVYNRLCDLEWDTPVGESRTCGGIFMIRAAAFRQVGGFRSSLIAGEEAELCLRLRRQGGKVIRIDAEMSLHDAAMTRFSQWWRRALRAGYGYAESAWLHGRGAERYCVRQVASYLFWGIAVPLVVIAGAWPTRGLSLLLLLGYPYLWWRIFNGQRQRGRSASDSHLYATFIVISKFAQAWGGVRFLMRKLLGRESRIIEYKETTISSTPKPVS